MKRWFWLAAAVVAADQLVKWLSEALGRRDIVLIPGVLQFTCTHNTGMAFSMLSGHSWLLGLLSAGAIALGWWILRRYRLGTFSRLAAMLMLGGAVGNMIDRLFRGYVVDMFEALFVRFAVFNVADAALTVGAGLMAVTLLFCAEDWKPKEKQEDTEDGTADGSPADRSDG
jgi:signal peptidase II